MTGPRSVTSVPSSSAERAGSDAERATEARVHALVARFYGDVRADPLLGPLFEARLEGRWHIHLPRIADFWVAVLLRSRRYSGNVYAAHMQIDGVTKAHVRRWLELWIEHVRTLPDPAEVALLQTVALRIGRTLSAGWFADVPRHEPRDGGHD